MMAIVNTCMNMPTSTEASTVDPEPQRLARLLQLCSANLPVGGFSFSQGMERAVEMGWIKDQETTSSWITLNLSESISRTDLPILQRLCYSLKKNDLERFFYWNNYLLACRESHELRVSELAMGKALMRLLANLKQLDLSIYHGLFAVAEMSFVGAFSLAACVWKIDLVSSLTGYCWTYIDNQVAAATKLVPLGQTQAQNLLYNLSHGISGAINTAIGLADDEIGASLPRLGMASAWHETQYSRLFRS